MPSLDLICNSCDATYDAEYDNPAGYCPDCFAEANEYDPAQEVQDGLIAMLLQQDDAATEALQDKIRQVQSFQSAFLLTNDKGIEIRFADGTEIQLTIVIKHRRYHGHA